MKTRAFCTALAVLALLASGCSSGLDTFTVDVESTAKIEGGSLLENFVGSMGFAGNFAAFDVAQTQEFKNQGVKKSQIDSVRMTSLTLTITDPASGGDFTFLDSLAFAAETDGQPRKQVASGGPFEKGKSSVSLKIDNVELKPYVSAPKMDLSTEVKGRKPSQDTTIVAKVVFSVDVNVSGLLD